MLLPGYEVEAEIGGRHRLFRARRESDGRRVLVEISPGRDEAAVSRLRRELEVSRYLDAGQRNGHIVRALDLVESDGFFQLFREDPGGWPLDRILDGSGSGRRPLAVKTALEVSRQLAGALSFLHLRGFIHRDIRPCHVLVDPASARTELMGLGCVSQVPREWQGFDPSSLTGLALAYISPEQTGRTNRLVDYRTDLYSLGVTLFEMLTGSLPFEARDPLELIHAHIARRPPSPSEVSPAVPEAVSRIVLKLLAKTAEERYQSGIGLGHDLERCLEEIEARGEPRCFDLGKGDVPARFELPQALYGREAEIERLASALDRVGRGETRVVVVTGYAGVGKTSLVRELRRHVLLRRGTFVAGKYNALDRGTPYSAILAALSDLVRQLLLEDPSRVSALAERLTEKLGPNLGVISGVLPELAALVGSPPSVEALEPVQAKHRFHLTVARFLAVFAAEDGPPVSGPLVLFLDDLQWIDPSSLELLASLLGPGAGNFLLVLAYRDNEVGERHPLNEALARVRSGGVEVETLGLPPLGPGDVERLVCDALRAEGSQAASLAELVYRKTAGNSFFVKSFLGSLHEEGYVVFTPSSGWSWDLSRIAGMEATENVADLTARKIGRLPEATRRVTAMAAALGHRFDVSTLAAVCGLAVDETEAHLIAACRERIVIKQQQCYHFEHDGLRESAYAFIPRETRADTHLLIGRLLMDRRAAEGEAQVFEIAQHLNRAAALLVTPGEREEAARQNLAAGRRARDSAAFPTAFQYFSRGLSFLGPSAWSESYALTLTLHNEAAEAAVLTADFDEADRLVEIVMANARALLDQVPSYEARIAAAHARLREEEALACCREILSLLGVEMSAEPGPAEIETAFVEAHRRAEPTLATALEDLRIMTDPAQLAACRVLVRMASIAGRADPTLGRLAATKLLDLAIAYGHSAPAAFAYILLGDIRCNVLNDLEGGHRAGAFGLALSERFDDRRVRLVCQTFYDVLIKTWKTPLVDLCEAFARGYRRAIEDGDFQIAGGNAYQLCTCELLSGRELAAVESTLRHHHSEISRLGQQMYAMTLERLLQVTLELSHRGSRAPASGSGDAPHRGRGADSNVEVRVAGPELMLRYVLREREAAHRLAIESETLPDHALPGIPFDFYRCLIFLAAGEEPLLDKVEPYRRKLAERARVAPASYRHKLDLVNAERCRVLGRTSEAVALYEKAIAGARRQGFVHEEALAHERAAELFLSLGADRGAVPYLEAAVTAYGRWGARRKVADLHRRYPELLSSRPSSAALPAAPAIAAADPGAVDRLSLERAASALAGELDLHELLQKLLAILLQNAGAQRGFLLRYGEDKIEIEATGSVDAAAGAIEVPRISPLEGCGEIAQSIVRYVVQSLERVVLGDASRDERFASDPYVAREQPKSILCAPILQQGQPVAIVYLENNRIPDAFVEDRLAAVHLISSQAAVALENARLHHELKEEVGVRQGVERDLRRALDEMARLKDRLEAENVYLRQEIKDAHARAEIVGESGRLKEVLHRVEQVAATDATVLVLGETGTGKELIARAVHGLGRRALRPLVKVNCATLPGTLIESELFGHEKGAFTGATSTKIGRFELADGGTIFLDEIGDLAPELQVKLLRVLQEGELERLGSSRTRRVDVRVIAATNRDLERLIAEGAFRTDLYYRLTVFPIEVPPLRERREDVPPLVWHFIHKKEERLSRRIREVPEEVMDTLTAHSWPGNVRELENAIERALILSPGPVLVLDGAFPAGGRARRPEPGAESLEEVEREHLRRVLEASGWKVKGTGNAAERLGLHPSTLRFRMKKLGIERPAP